MEPRDLNVTDKNRANHIVDRALALDAGMAATLLAEVLENFQGRHRNLLEIFEARADEMENAFAAHSTFTVEQRRLIGAYFLNEYSFEAAALFNPSIVAHLDQAGVPAGARRFILSLRAVGEGHISSLTFRSGLVAADGAVSVDPSARLASVPKIVTRNPGPDGDDVELAFSAEQDLSERVIFPVTHSQSNGIEDARFVEFNEDGQRTYYATYTAYNGKAIRSELLETRDFLKFRMSPLRGAATRNKGMALFPRRINGRYAMIARQDNENLYLIYSDDKYTWNDGGVAVLKPQFPWEFVQIGNCGSPIEIDEGWLLLTHGVGPVRKYSIGAVLLDKNDPSKVLGRAREPLVKPEPSEREGYVPNVVYTCGAMRHNDQIVLPYAVSDTFSNFATIEIAALMKLIGC
ncbi:MAG TPA: glycoside hydrolase family 130 protein [Steroidobacteraceae bacterium]